MKVAIYHNLPSGGGKRALYEMARRLAARHEIDVFTLSTANHDFCDLRRHCQQHVVFPFQTLPLARRPIGRLNRGMRSVDLIRLDSLQRKIAQGIDRGDYDVVFVHNCQFSQSPGLLKFLHTRSAYYCQEPPRFIYEPPAERPYSRLSLAQRFGNVVDPLPGLYRRTLRRLDRANVEAADAVLVNSHYSRETLYRAYGIFATVCYLGVDVQKFMPLPVAKENFVLSVGQLRPKKGFEFLIEGISHIEAGRRPPLVIVSNATSEGEKAYLKQLACESDVEVLFRDRISDTEMVGLYNQALATVYAPVMEPFGFVPLESMACGTPVVGVREGGVRETVMHGVTGLLTDRDPQKFAAALDELLVDTAWASELGQNGLRQARETWTWEGSLVQLEESLQAVSA